MTNSDYNSLIIYPLIFSLLPQILLKLARNIFEEQSNLECLVTKIMTEARDLLKCERCAVFLLKTETSEASHLERILERPGRVVRNVKNHFKNTKIHDTKMIDIPRNTARV